MSGSGPMGEPHVQLSGNTGGPVAAEDPSSHEAGHQPAAGADSSVAPDDGWEWAIVEIFGHRRHAGRVREEERFGAKMLRVDVPIKGDAAANGWETHYYGGSAIFSFTPTDEATATRLNKPYDAAHQYRLPLAATGDGDAMNESLHDDNGDEE